MLERVQIGEIRGTLKRGGTGDYLVVVCHGYKSSGRHPAIQSITDGLYKRGHTLFVFDFSPNSEPSDIEQQVADTKRVAAHFSCYKGIVLLAGSFGALSAAIATSQLPQVHGLITVNGFFGSARLGRQLWPQFVGLRLLSLVRDPYRRIWRYYRQNFRAERIAAPVLVVHSRADRDVHMSQSRRFAASLTGPKELRILEEADHHLTTESSVAAVIELVDAWLLKRCWSRRSQGEGPAG
jgi:pimeloyl-ACP methyl ester carboxylesterase